jgi:hypothetical protein
MDLSSYVNLQGAIRQFINRNDLDDVIPIFIALAEAQMNRRLRCRRMVGRADAVLEAGEEFIAVPNDFIGPIDFVLKTTPPVRLSFLESQSLLARKAGGVLAGSGTPESYALVGDEFQILPVPTTDMEAELTYWKRPPLLSDSNSSNWVLLSHPDIYLYGALVQSAPYLADDSRTPIWSALFSQAIADANAGDPVPVEESQLRADDIIRLTNRYDLNINTGT